MGSRVGVLIFPSTLSSHSSFVRDQASVPAPAHPGDCVEGQAEPDGSVVALRLWGTTHLSLPFSSTNPIHSPLSVLSSWNRSLQSSGLPWESADV